MIADGERVACDFAVVGVGIDPEVPAVAGSSMAQDNGIVVDERCRTSAADIYAAMLATWNADVPAFFRKHPNVKSIYGRVTARPAVAKTWARSGMNDWNIQAASA